MSWMDEIGQDLPHEDYVDTLNVEDQEAEWRKERLGKVTGSILGKLVKKQGTGYKLSEGKVASDLLYKIAWERFLITESEGMNRLNVSSREMQHGNDYELAAMMKFQEVTGINVTPSGYKFLSNGEFFGGSPDGDTDDEGIIEAKSPWNGGNHLKTLLTRKIYNDEHFYQVQGYLWLTGKSHCWYVTYDPDLPEGLNIAYIKIERDEQVIEAIRDIVNQCREIIVKLIEQAKSKLK